MTLLQNETRTLTPNQAKIYGEIRFGGMNIRLEDVMEIHIHNGYLEPELEKDIQSEAGDDYRRVQQVNEREPIFYHEKDVDSQPYGILDIAQWSGNRRRERYERAIKAYIEATGRTDIQLKSLELPGGSKSTNTMYEHLAYDFIKAMIYPETLNEKNKFKRVFPEEQVKDIKDIRNIVFGPVEAFRRYANQHSDLVKIVSVGDCEYINVQVVNINGIDVLNINYVYGDQISLIISKAMKLYDAVAKERRFEKEQQMNAYMFGRCGGLKQGMEINDIVIPTGIIKEKELRNGQVIVHPMTNILADYPGYKGKNLHVRNIIDETVELLETARKAGCDSVDLEAYRLKGAAGLESDTYGSFDVNIGIALHVSDRPLLPPSKKTGERETVAEERDVWPGKIGALEIIIDHIAKQG